MSKYALMFSKKGYIRFTSHLDLLRIFKRAFRRAGIAVSYSQGFNPHPKMGFCQPLSLGYTGSRELIEFQTESDKGRKDWMAEMQGCLPDGIKLIRLGLISEGQKSLAASVFAADYSITFPVPFELLDFDKKVSEYIAQDMILCSKKMKSGKTAEVDIKQKIREIKPVSENGKLVLKCTLDSGSSSNLSPELVIRSFLDFTLPYTERFDISVTRDDLMINVDYDITWM